MRKGNDMKTIPRWQQGLPSFAYEDVRRAMTPAERRRAFVSDLFIGVGGAAATYFVLKYIGG